MKEIYFLKTIEDMRAFMVPLRMRIVALIGERKMTAKQIATELDLPPTRVHYHVKELERIGVLKFCGTKIKRNMVERYLRKVARFIQLSDTERKERFKKMPDDKQHEVTSDFLLNSANYMRDQVSNFINSKAWIETKNRTRDFYIAFHSDDVYLNKEEKKEFYRAYRRLIEKYVKKEKGKVKHNIFYMVLPNVISNVKSKR